MVSFILRFVYIDMWCLGMLDCSVFFDLAFSVFSLLGAMKKAGAESNADCLVKIKLVAPLPKEQGISVLNNAHKACSMEIEHHKGTLTVSEWDEKLLAEHIAKLVYENEEVDRDDGSEEEDTGTAKIDLEDPGGLS